MKYVKPAGIAVLAIGLPLLLGACDWTASANGHDGGQQTSNQQSSNQQTASQSAQQPTSQQQPTGNQSSPTAGTPAPPPAGQATRCHTQDLSARLGTPQGAPDAQQTVALIYTNTSGRACTLNGFVGVDLHGADHLTFGPTFSLTRNSDTPALITLAPGGTAHATITVLAPSVRGPNDGQDAWTPDSVVTTPPDETTQLTVPWTGGPVLRQDGATHPGSFVGSLVEGTG
ncbi:DUF4232 domain-containing protein [Solihabitans fulvus]|uniref:DUF4232 domain-containing protein n=1 Tax=Solihabitans fulvus TaxID=1892852 RepID=A0A5B2WXP9_9PSEU|nr:DUF4232 domain-containing protein [Solihabitans fulvus]KAA2256331.1 DUF4232 domain-containing protein [Solihabitans fulvus]